MNNSIIESNIYEAISEYEPAPVPTTLFGIEPIGVDTPFIESLSSYVSRVAAAHMLSVSALMKYVIASTLPDTKHNLGTTIGNQRIIKEMNGMGKEAVALVDSLEKLTGRSGLKHLTMIPFTGQLAPKGLMSPNSAWCPYCLNQQRERGQSIYIPLLWCINMPVTCLEHETPLHVTCPNCSSESPILTSRSIAGYCANCDYWLGVPYDNIEKKQPLNNSFYIDLLRNANEFINKKTTFPSLLNYLIGKKMKTADNVALARLLKCSEAIIRSWLHGEALPSLEAVLKIAELFNLDPIHILTISGEEMSRSDSEAIASIKKTEAHSVNINWPQLHALLNDVAKGRASSISLMDIARVYKCSPEQISDNYPELCFEVTERFNMQIHCKKKDAGVTLTDTFDKVVKHFLESGVRPTRRLILDLVGYKDIWICPIVCYKYSLAVHQNCCDVKTHEVECIQQM